MIFLSERSKFDSFSTPVPCLVEHFRVSIFPRDQIGFNALRFVPFGKVYVIYTADRIRVFNVRHHADNNSSESGNYLDGNESMEAD